MGGFAVKYLTFPGTGLLPGAVTMDGDLGATRSAGRRNHCFQKPQHFVYGKSQPSKLAGNLPFPIEHRDEVGVRKLSSGVFLEIDTQ